MVKEKMQTFRHEDKYVISTGELQIIQNRIDHLLVQDPYTGSSGIYNVCSLYFDDYYDSCVRSNENGLEPREKFRIRIYNHSSENIKLECKRKERGMTRKTACSLTVQETRWLMAGKVLPNIETQPELLRKLTLQMLQRHLKPVVIVEYDRIPYIFKNGNVRVTLDTNISSTTDVKAFLNETIATRPVMPVGCQLLEVKYDEYLPGFIYQSLQLQNLCRSTYSKYQICRRITR